MSLFRLLIGRIGPSVDPLCPCMNTRKGTAGQIAMCLLLSVSRTFLRPALQAYTVLYSVFRVWERSTQCHPKGRRLGGFKKALQDRCTQGSQQLKGRGEATLTLHELIMQRLIDHDRNNPTASLLSFLVWVILYFFGMLKNDIYKFSDWFCLTFKLFFTIFFVSFLYLFMRALARTLDMFWHLWCRGFQPTTM